MLDKTMAALATVLEQAGIETVDQYESDGREESPYSSVVFYGDDGAGIRAVKVAQEHDYHPQGLVRDWAIVGDEICEPHWMMLFD